MQHIFDAEHDVSCCYVLFHTVAQQALCAPPSSSPP
jgi:hypothetical protein